MHEYYMVRLGMIRWSIWLDEKTVAALKKVGAEMERPVGWLVRKAVEEFIERGAQERRKQVK
jgi:predicted transcriptional regulator